MAVDVVTDVVVVGVVVVDVLVEIVDVMLDVVVVVFTQKSHLTGQRILFFWRAQPLSGG